jgi:tetratricopeptide (TPR) repeat protein
MDQWSIMSLIIIVALLTLVLLICVFAGNVFAEEAGVKTAGTSGQIASLGTPFPQPKADLAYEAGGTLKGDMPAAKTHHDLGVVYLEKGQYDLALAEFNKALEIYSMSAEIYNNRGITYSKMGRYDFAISDFTTAIRINPAGDKPYYNRGTTYALNGQYAQSLLDFDRTFEHTPFNEPLITTEAACISILHVQAGEKPVELEFATV